MYQELEQEVLKISNYIHFNDKQLNVYSLQNANIISKCMFEYESIVKALFEKLKGYVENRPGLCLKYLDERLQLHKKQVKIVSSSIHFRKTMSNYFAPLCYKEHGHNDFYSAYCALKHNRAQNINKATINILIRSLASLFLMNLFYYGNEIVNMRQKTSPNETIFIEKYAGESIGIMHDLDIKLNKYLDGCVGYISLDLGYYLYRDEQSYNLRKLIKETKTLIGLNAIKDLIITHQNDIRTLIYSMICQTMKDSSTSEKIKQVNSITMGCLEKCMRIYNINKGYRSIYIPIKNMDAKEEELIELGVPEPVFISEKLYGVQKIDRILELLG